MQRTSGRMLLVAASLILVWACKGGRQADKLDRDTALALLRENGDTLRGPTWEMDLVVYDTGPADAARLRFLRSLTPGVVKLVSTTDAESPGFTAMPSWMEKRPRVRRYEFEPSDPKSASTLMRDQQMKPVYFKIAVPQYEEITGIVQEGTLADVSVSLSYTPNDLYRRIATAVDQAGSQPGFPLPRLASPADLAKTGTRHVAFRRYDDGWRVETSHLF